MVVLLREVVVVVDWVEEVPGSAGIAFRFCMVLHGFAEGSSAKDATNNHLQSTKSEVVFVFFCISMNMGNIQATTFSQWPNRTENSWS